VSRNSAFGIRKRAQSSLVECSAVECYPEENGSWRSDRFVNQNQVSHSGREHTRSKVVLGSHWLWAVINDCNCKDGSNKCNHPIQNLLLLVTESRTWDILVSEVVTTINDNSNLLGENLKNIKITTSTLLDANVEAGIKNQYNRKVEHIYTDVSSPECWKYYKHFESW
jgi:hypothetical protein